MRTFYGTILAVVCIATCANAADGGNGLPAGRANIDLNSGWRFMRCDVEGAEAPGLDDSGWKCVSVPHDWAIEGPFDKTNDVQFVKVVQDGETRENLKLGRTGALPWVGAGWYRRRIVIPPGAAHVELEFDGAMSDSKVYVDGRLVGGRPNGYVPFTVDISDVNAVINMMLGKADKTSAADVTGDGSVDIADVNMVINIMLGKD